MRSQLLALNVRHRMREVAGIDIGDRVMQDIEEQYFARRTELRQQLLLLQFRGPDDLAAQAARVRNADRALRDARFELDDNGQLIGMSCLTVCRSAVASWCRRPCQ